jgi:anaerobic magnesium-protoporphyrin IX monomethyl ester cyclase
MKILLINICLRYDSPHRIPPVGLACIATALHKADFDVDIYDIDLYRYTDEQVMAFLNSNNDYDMVGMGCLVTGYKYIKKFAHYVKSAMPQTCIVVGNTLATSVPELLLSCVPEVDVAVLGEGDCTVVSIAQSLAAKKEWRSLPGIAYRNGNEVFVSKETPYISDLDSLSFPDYSLLDIEAYLPYTKKIIAEPHPLPISDLWSMPVNTARGCPFSCTFCYHAFINCSYRYYSFDRVVQYIKSLQEKYKVNYIHFWDELTFVSAARLEELCDAIEEYDLRFYWTINARVNTFTKNDVPLLKRAKLLGALRMGVHLSLLLRLSVLQ